jgi:hypothetical protein
MIGQVDRDRRRGWSGPSAALWASVVVVSCAPVDHGAVGQSAASRFGVDVPATARVLANSTMCTVDADCHLRLEFADTTVSVLYGTGDRPSAACEVPRQVSDMAFTVREYQMVEVTISVCAANELYLRALRPIGEPTASRTGSDGHFIRKLLAFADMSAPSTDAFRARLPADAPQRPVRSRRRPQVRGSSVPSSQTE